MHSTTYTVLSLFIFLAMGILEILIRHTIPFALEAQEKKALIQSDLTTPTVYATYGTMKSLMHIAILD